MYSWFFENDFTIFNDLSTHLEKIKNFFLKCRKYAISLNLETCALMVCSGIILGFIISKEGKTHYPKKIKVVKMLVCTQTPQEIQVFNGMA